LNRQDAKIAKKYGEGRRRKISTESIAPGWSLSSIFFAIFSSFLGALGVLAVQTILGIQIAFNPLALDRFRPT
jgi:hypothetical protein